MRIDRLKLPRFRNLVDFEVDFDEGSPRQVIVGRNGVGKSNLLEAIVRIFRDLDLEEGSTFPYEIVYLCRGRSVRIINSEVESNSAIRHTTYRREYQVAIEGSKDILGEMVFSSISETEFYRRNRMVNNVPNPDRLLPSYVFGYYSGDLSRFEGIFSKHEENYYAAQIKGEEAPLRPLFLARPHHSQFAFLSFFAVPDEGARAFLRSEMRIEDLDAVLFAIREPYWSKNKGRDGEERDLRFWGAAGKVAPFLASLFENSFVPMAFRERMKVSVGQSETKERRFCYVPSKNGLEKMAGALSNKEFFARLESLVFSNLVSEDGSDVRIWLKLKDVGEPATFNDLAEGERQLLTVLGLLRFTAEDEALFILDEPDTHLNPAWCLDYLTNIKDYGADLKSSQIIMTTHSPLTFAGLDKCEVVVMERAQDGRIYAEHPTTSPKGMGFQAILTSDFFKLRTTLDRETLSLLDKKRELALKDEKTDRDREEIAQLDKQLGRLDFSHAARDPLYLEFIRAITKAQQDHPGFADAVPNENDWRLRKKVATDIAKRLIEKGQER